MNDRELGAGLFLFGIQSQSKALRPLPFSTHLMDQAISVCDVVELQT